MSAEMSRPVTVTASDGTVPHDPDGIVAQYRHDVVSAKSAKSVRDPNTSQREVQGSATIDQLIGFLQVSELPTNPSMKERFAEKMNNKSLQNPLTLNGQRDANGQFVLDMDSLDDDAIRELFNWREVRGGDATYPFNVNFGGRVGDETLIPTQMTTTIAQEGAYVPMFDLVGVDNNPRSDLPLSIDDQIRAELEKQNNSGVEEDTFTAPSQEWIEHLSKREGDRERTYHDSLGKLTGGIGHLLSAEEQKKYPEGTKVPSSVLKKWFEDDTRKALEAGRKQADELGIDDEQFAEALASVNFQLGTGWTKEHKNTWKLLMDGEYEAAAKEAANSTWNTQTPVRVKDFQESIRQLDELPYGDDDGEFASGESAQFFADLPTAISEIEKELEEEAFDAPSAFDRAQAISPEVEQEAGKWILEALTDPDLPPAILARIKGLLPDTLEAGKLAGKWLGRNLSTTGIYHAGEKGVLTEEEIQAIDTNPNGSYQRLIESGIDPNSRAAWLSLALDPTNFIDPAKGMFTALGFGAMAIKPVVRSITNTRVLTNPAKITRPMPDSIGHGIVVESKGGTTPFTDVTDIMFDIKKAGEAGDAESVVQQGLIIYGGDLEATKKMLAQLSSSGWGKTYGPMLKKANDIIDSDSKKALATYKKNGKSSGYGTEVTLPKDIDDRVLHFNTNLFQRESSGELTGTRYKTLKENLTKVWDEAELNTTGDPRLDISLDDWLAKDGDKMYAELVDALGSQQEASKLLVKHGIIGKRSRSSYSEQLAGERFKDDQYTIYDSNELSINTKQTDVTKPATQKSERATKGTPEYGSQEKDTQALLSFMDDFNKVFVPTGLTGRGDAGTKLSPSMRALVEISVPDRYEPGTRTVYLEILKTIKAKARGGGSALMELKRLADKHGIAMIGKAEEFSSVAGDKALTQTDLEKFYGKLGGKMDPATGDFVYFPKGFPLEKQQYLLDRNSGRVRSNNTRRATTRDRDTELVDVETYQKGRQDEQQRLMTGDDDSFVDDGVASLGDNAPDDRPSDELLQLYAESLDPGRTLRDIDPNQTATEAEMLLEMSQAEISRAMDLAFRTR